MARGQSRHRWARRVPLGKPGPIKKVPHTHRYLLTDYGRVAIAAISAAQHATVTQLSKVA
jgi:hypothetical protein